MSEPDAITRVHAREVLDSRGNPTVEAEVWCAGGARGRAIAPSGASTGTHEAVELRDGDPIIYGGKGVLRAVANVREVIQPRLVGLPATDQEKVDRTLCELDGTSHKSHLGANAILAVSLATAHAAAACRNVPLWGSLGSPNQACLPMPMINMISGGLHAGGNLDVQDFLLIPVGAETFAEALEMAADIYHRLGAILTRHGFQGVLVGDEGGFGPRLRRDEQAIKLILEAITAAGYTPGRHAALAIDMASTQFFRDGRYVFGTPLRGRVSADWMIGLLERWVKHYPIFSIEDGLAEDDWEGWQKLTAALGDKVQLVGDDLFVTNPERLRRGIERGVANSVLVKPNQVGTLTETLEVIALARSAGYRPVISARSGETEDTTIADLAVATGAGQIKIGSVARSERLAKYNQLLRIEEEMGEGARFAAWQPVGPRAPA
jgi:enolase